MLTPAPRTARAKCPWAFRSLTVIGLALFALAISQPGTGHAGPNLAMPSGTPATGIGLHNTDDTTADVVVSFFPEDGQPRVDVQRNRIRPGAQANIYLPGEQSLRRNTRYAAVTTSNGRAPGVGLTAIVRTEWPATGGVVAYSGIHPADEVVAPLVQKRYFGRTSWIAVQNASANEAVRGTIAVTITQVGSASPVAVVPLRLLGRRSAILELDKITPALPDGFLGSAVIRGNVPVAAQIFTGAESGVGIDAYEGVPSETIGNKLYAPLIHNNVGGFTTGIAVQNLSNNPVQVTVSYYGCGDSFIVHGRGPQTIPPLSSGLFYQRNSASPTGASGLPENCQGSAIIGATGGKIVAIVTDGRTASPDGPGAAFSTYNAISLGYYAAHRISVPLWRKRNTNLRFTSLIQMMNTGEQAADVTVELKDSTGNDIRTCGGQCSFPIPPSSSHAFYLGSISGVGDNTYGSAIITGDQALAVVVGEYPEVPAYDTSMYNGIPIVPPPAPRFGNFLPFAANRAIRGRTAGAGLAPMCQSVLDLLRLDAPLAPESHGGAGGHLPASVN